MMTMSYSEGVAEAEKLVGEADELIAESLPFSYTFLGDEHRNRIPGTAKTSTQVKPPTPEGPAVREGRRAA